MAGLVFIGGIGKPDEYGGELSKNKLIISRLRKSGLKLSVADTYNARRNPLKLWSLPLKVLANPKAPVVFSTNFGNIRHISALITKLYPRRRQILWVIGGVLADKIINNEFKVSDFTCFDTIFVESRSMQRKMESVGLTSAVYLPNFKDKSQCGTTCSFEGLDTQLRCVFFSRIEPSKGVDIILDALESDALKGKNITVDFYGEIKSVYKKRFEERISKLDNVRYCGKLNFFDGSGQKTLADYHLALFPTYWVSEGFPGVIVDAFFAGLPVLASDWNYNT